MQEILKFGVESYFLLPWSFYEMIINATESSVQVEAFFNKLETHKKKRKKKNQCFLHPNPK